MNCFVLWCIILYYRAFTTWVDARQVEVFISKDDQRIIKETDSTCNPNEFEFQKLLLHSDVLYIGSSNNILQINLTNTGHIDRATIGPQEDATLVNNCGPKYCGPTNCGNKFICVNNKVRILTVLRNKIFTCGSYKGVCDIFPLHNISQTYQPTVDEKDLKCQPKSQIANGGPSIKFSSYQSPVSSNKDLLYVSQASGFITNYPPTDVDFQIDLIDDTSKYLDTRNSCHHALWTTSNHTFSLRKDHSTGGQAQEKISRVCHPSFNQLTRNLNEDSTNYGKTSYTETNVGCGDGFALEGSGFYTGGNHGMVYAVFRSLNGQARICSTSTDDINDHMNKARRYCSMKDSSYLTNEGKDVFSVSCTRSLPDSWVTCGLNQDAVVHAHPLKCRYTLNFTLEFEWSVPVTTNLTTVLVDNVNGFKIAFVATSAGKVQKIRLGTTSNPLIETISLHAGNSFNSVLPDLILDESNEQIFALTSSAIYKVALEDCGKFTTCEDCLTLNDPYCGWCVLENSCKRKSTCLDKWFDNKASKCPSMTISPQAHSITDATRMLSVSLSGAPLPDKLYSCSFYIAEEKLEFVSSLVNNTCASPSISPQLLYGKDHIVVTLKYVYNGIFITSSTYDVYSCIEVAKTNPNKRCNTCVTSKYHCNWCSEDFTCQDTCGAKATHRNSSMCPTVITTESNNQPIPVGHSKDITVVTKNLPKNKAYKCLIKVCEDIVYKVDAVVDVDKIACSVEASKMKCDKLESILRVSIEHGIHIIDSMTLGSGHVALYNCSAGVQQCAICTSTHLRFPSCVWCNAKSQCTMDTHCNTQKVDNVTQCQNPKISRVSPLSGPVSGKTEIRIEGSNMGSISSDIQSVVINNVPCDLVREKYSSAVKVVCVTRTSTQEISGQVTLTTTYGSTATSTEHFYFKRVTADSFMPRDILGGTILSVKGTNMDIGNSAFLQLTNISGLEYNIPCGNERSPTSMTCKTPAIIQSGKYSLFINVDGFKHGFSSFIDVMNTPTISGLPERNKLIVIRSGGQVVNFEMTSLVGVQNAIIQVAKKTSKCKLDFNMTVIACSIPNFNPISRTKRQISNESISTSVPASIIVNDVLSIPLSGEFALSYVDDPFVNVPTTITCGSGRSSDIGTLTFSGSQNLDAVIESDYNITIYSNKDIENAAMCAILVLDDSSMTCQYKVNELEKYTGEKLVVKVQVGNLTFVSKELSYCDSSSFLIILILVPILAVLVIIIVLLVWHNRRKHHSQLKERKRVMQLVEKMENKTRENARRAFSQLQLAYMTPLEANISDQIAFQSPVVSFMKSLFNDTSTKHPVLASAKVDIPDEKREGLQAFLGLLNNREFMLLFIRTLEDQKKFTVKEKGHVASLLTICFFDNLSYLTKVMLELLSELIEKHVSKHPKLLLRRSESVVEKLVSHWLTVTLYHQCIEEQAGKSLFLLAKSIHYLVTSGPCDVIANKAMNSLNEMTLLGSEIEYKTITLQASVLNEEDGTNTEPVKVKVIDCDTITQVKAKIIEVVYKDYPFAEWPKPDDLELEMLSEGTDTGKTLLSDIDTASHKEDGYTQINTIKRYSIPTMTKVILSPASKINKEPTSPMSGGYEQFIDRNYSFNLFIEEVRKEVSANGVGDSLLQSKKRLYHLIHPRDDESTHNCTSEDAENGNVERITSIMNRPFQEIYLTRMIKSKTIIQEYVDGVFKSILSPKPIPRAVNYFFQFLDHEAIKHKVTEPEIIHIWKTNSLLLRYWVNILKNPEFIFDIDKSMIVDSCLNVITQAFMDACTTSPHKLGQDSPSNKLLYAKDAMTYKDMVKGFFENIAKEETVTYEEMCKSLTKESKKYSQYFDKISTAREIFMYFDKYKNEILNDMRSSGVSNLLPTAERILANLSSTYNGNVYENTKII